MSFRIENACNVSVTNLNILRCGSASLPAILLQNVQLVLLDTMHITYSEGSGLVAENCLPSIKIMNSKFDHNCEVYYRGIRKYTYGNVFIRYAIRNRETKVEIVNTIFSNCNGNGGYSGGLTIEMRNYRSQTLNVTLYITGCIFFNNTGGRQNGGNMRIVSESVSYFA